MMYHHVVIKHNRYQKFFSSTKYNNVCAVTVKVICTIVNIITGM